MINHQTQVTKLHRKVKFYLEQDEDGWPPETVETLWAKDVGGGMYEIDTIPFFVRGIAYKDVVFAEPSDEELLFRKVVRPSGHNTIRIIFLDLAVKTQTCAALEGKGCAWEGSHLDSLVSVDVPPSVCYNDVKQLLVKGEEAGQWEYEEGCLSSE